MREGKRRGMAKDEEEECGWGREERWRRIRRRNEGGEERRDGEG